KRIYVQQSNFLGMSLYIECEIFSKEMKGEKKNVNARTTKEHHEIRHEWKWKRKPRQRHDEEKKTAVT
ncbi:hypothetical protein HMI55_004543, partial [Coelomomyces lativittatus]